MIRQKIILYIFVLNICKTFCDDEDAPKKYYNYTLYRGIPVNDEHMSYFKNLDTMYNVSFWREPGMLNKPVDFVIGPSEQPYFMKDVIKYGLYITTIMKDVQKAFDQQIVKSYITRRTDSYDWYHYYRIADIYEWIRDLSRIYPNIMKFQSIGKTSENRDIMAVRILLTNITSNCYNKCKRRKVFIEGGIHAREWISTAFVTYMINAIVHAPSSTDSKLRAIAYMYEWHFVPALNPDGYEYSHTKDRMWRKNRRDQGVDINRNFGYAFGKVGISFNSKSDVYCGTKAFSENESKALAHYVMANGKNLEYYISFHSYGQFMIIPYAHTKTHMDNFNEVRSIGIDAAKTIKSMYGTVYTIGTAFDTVGYMTSGISGDWVKKTLSVPHVITFELRDTGRFGFALPPSQILPTCKETMRGLVTLLNPRTKEWQEKILKPPADSQERSFLDNFVILFNACLFIIVRFDYIISIIFLTNLDEICLIVNGDF